MIENLLIVGSTGTIGSNALNYFVSKGISAFHTSRKKNLSSRNHIYFDLNDLDDLASIPLYGITHAVICAGINGRQECESNLKSSLHTNVTRTIELINYFYSNKIFVIFLSTSLVFDGTKALPTISDPTAPTSQYALQKATVEDYVLKNIPNEVAIIRPTKIISNNDVLFRNWLFNILDNKSFKASTILNISPLGIDFFLQCLHAVLANKISGIVQISPTYQVTYYQLALKMASLLGKPTSFIAPNYNLINYEFKPYVYTNLASNIQDLTHINLPTPYDFLEDFISNNLKLP